MFVGYIEQNSSGVRIDCTERVIQEINICVTVDCSSQLNSLLLTSAHVQSSLTNLCKVSMVKILYILVQRTSFYCLVVQFPVKRFSE